MRASGSRARLAAVVVACDCGDSLAWNLPRGLGRPGSWRSMRHNTQRDKTQLGRDGSQVFFMQRCAPFISAQTWVFCTSRCCCNMQDRSCGTAAMGSNNTCINRFRSLSQARVVWIVSFGGDKTSRKSRGDRRLVSPHVCAAFSRCTVPCTATVSGSAMHASAWVSGEGRLSSTRSCAAASGALHAPRRLGGVLSTAPCRAGTQPTMRRPERARFLPGRAQRARAGRAPWADVPRSGGLASGAASGRHGSQCLCKVRRPRWRHGGPPFGASCFRLTKIVAQVRRSHLLSGGRNGCWLESLSSAG